MKILVIGPSWIGDMMMSQALYRTIKFYYPKSIIDVIAPEWSLPLLLRMPEIRNAILMPFNHGVLNVWKRRQIGLRLKNKNYDHAYILPNSFKSALIPFFAKIPRRTGWKGEMRYGLLNDLRVLNKKDWPLMVERYLALAYDQNIVCNAKSLPKPLLWPKIQILNDEVLQTCDLFKLSLIYPIIGFFPGAEFGPAKRWPHYHYSELAKQLIKEGYQILIFGSFKEHEIGNQIISLLDSKQKSKCRNLVGKILLNQSISLIAACKIIVTNDSGLMHVAAALNLPIIAIYGPSSPNFTPPLSNKSKVIRLVTGYQKIRRGSKSEKGYHQSLIKISPSYVLKELKKLIVKY